MPKEEDRVKACCWDNCHITTFRAVATSVNMDTPVNGVQIVVCGIPRISLTDCETLVGTVIDHEVNQIRAPIDGLCSEKALEAVDVRCTCSPGLDVRRVIWIIGRCMSHSPGLNAQLRV